MKTVFKIMVITWTGLMIAACGDGSSSFSLLSDSDEFQQLSASTNAKIDILWVIDNSGSMESSQQSLATNFNSFINTFVNQGYDYHMAVTTTQAYRMQFTGNQNDARFRDRNDSTVSGVHVITPSTVNPVNVFMINASQGINGSGDERAFRSFYYALENPANAGYNFLRNDSFLQVIIVSDEDDFSHTGTNLNESYSNPNLYSINSFENYLDTKTGSVGADKRYAVSAIAIFDTACRDLLNTTFTGRKVGVRYGQLVDRTEFGMKTSLCSNFAQSLQDLAQRTAQGATQFKLSRIPIPHTLNIVVNGVQKPACYLDTAEANRPTPLASGSTINNPAGCGFTYNDATNSVIFGVGHTPPQGANITVTYDPVAYGQ